MNVTAVIPVLNDSEALRQLIEDLRLQSHEPDSVIVVSGSRDEQLRKLASENRLNLIETTASRGLQLDSGARAAKSDIFWFLHADARVPLHACESIVNAVTGGAEGGCLRFTLQGERSFTKRRLEQLVRLRIACGGMAYGDQALFCTARAYQASGGFAHEPLFEEVQLVRHLQHNGLFRALQVPVFVSPRRWERDGWLKRSIHNRWLALLHSLGVPPRALARRYNARADNEQSKHSPSKIAESQG